MHTARRSPEQQRTTISNTALAGRPNSPRRSTARSVSRPLFFYYGNAPPHWYEKSEQITLQDLTGKMSHVNLPRMHRPERVRANGVARIRQMQGDLSTQMNGRESAAK